MIVKKKKLNKIRIDLSGPDGNAFVLLGIAKNICQKNNIMGEWPRIQKEMTSGNYENLVQTLDKYFGSILILER